MKNNAVPAILLAAGLSGCNGHAPHVNVNMSFIHDRRDSAAMVDAHASLRSLGPGRTIVIWRKNIPVEVTTSVNGTAVSSIGTMGNEAVTITVNQNSCWRALVYEQVGRYTFFAQQDAILKEIFPNETRGDNHLTQAEVCNMAKDAIRERDTQSNYV